LPRRYHRRLLIEAFAVVREPAPLFEHAHFDVQLIAASCCIAEKSLKCAPVKKDAGRHAARLFECA